MTKSPAAHAASLSKCLVAFILVAMVPPVALAGNPSNTGSVAEPKESMLAGDAEAVESQVSKLLADGHCAKALAALLRMQAATRPPHMMIWLCRAQYRCGSAAEAVAACNAVQAPTEIFSEAERTWAQSTSTLARYRLQSLASGDDEKPRQLDRTHGVLGPRSRFEVGLEGGIAAADVNNKSANDKVGGGGSHLRIGVQINGWLDTQVELSAAGILFNGYARIALTAGFTPIRWFTVSAGPVVGYLAGVTDINSGTGQSSNYAGGTLRIDLHVYQKREESGRRHSFTLGIGGDLGGSFGSHETDFLGRMYSSSLSTVSGNGMFNIGYTVH